jgi:hypothetical protein
VPELQGEHANAAEVLVAEARQVRKVGCVDDIPNGCGRSHHDRVHDRRAGDSGEGLAGALGETLGERLHLDELEDPRLIPAAAPPFGDDGRRDRDEERATTRRREQSDRPRLRSLKADQEACVAR